VNLLVALALGPSALQPYAGEFLGPDARAAAATPGYFETLVQARRVMAPVHALLVSVAALLVWRLWGRTAGLLAGLLLALDPFLVAHGRILRTDALLAELLVVAVLASLAFWTGRAAIWALALCAAATGLALLTKTPALALLGIVPTMALAGAWLRPHPSPLPKGEGASGLPLLRLRVKRLGGGGLLLTLALWLVGSIGVVVALWPAMWARPLRAVERLAVYTQEKGGSPMEAGGFFLGSSVLDPGPLYYLVALPLRLSPLVLIGLVVWPFVRGVVARRGVGLMLLVGLGLAVVLALLPKKADRYVLPAMPFLTVVAAVGLAALAERWRDRGALGVVGATLAGGVALLTLVWPYPLAFYDPLLGGGPMAARLISVGWGEGLDQAAHILNALPNARGVTVASPYPEVLQAQFDGRAVDLDAYDLADYAVSYVAASQRQLADVSLDAALATRRPLSRVEIAGVPYAELYALERPAFGEGLRLSQVAVSPSLTTRGANVSVQLAWEGPSSGDLEAELALVDGGDGTPLATALAPVVADGQPRVWTVKTPNRRDKYIIAVRVRDRRDGRWLPVSVWPLGPWHDPDRLVFRSAWVRVQ
jgi:hypothetical protein